MKNAAHIAAWAIFIIAFQLHAETAPLPTPGSPKQSALVKQTSPKRNTGGEYQQRLAKQQEIKKAIREKRVIVGMTPKEVRSAWGWPELVHPVHGIDESTDRWTFRRKDQVLAYLYFRNGILERINY